MLIRYGYDQRFTDILDDLVGECGQELLDIDGIGDQVDLPEYTKRFFKSGVTADASVDPNSNINSVDVVTYNTEVHKPLNRLDAYHTLFQELTDQHGDELAEAVIRAQLRGLIYINDAHGIRAPYCFNYSAYDIALQGLPMVKAIDSRPPKHLYAFKSQVEQFIPVAANSTLGATGLADLLIVMAYYAERVLDNLKDDRFTFSDEEAAVEYIKTTLVSFIYTINQPMRGNQSPFVNVSVFDDNFLQELVPSYTFPDYGSPRIDTVKLIQELFLQAMNEELERTPITFPVVTAAFEVDEENRIKDEEFLQEIASYNAKWGFINIFAGESSTIASCCRLRSDSSNEYFNSFGAGSTKIGSLGVVTVNLPRLAYQAVEEDEPADDFLEGLVAAVNAAGYINNAKRRIISRLIERGNLPLYNLGIMDLSKQYSTCGINGLSEALEILGYNILSEAGQQLVMDVIEAINETNDTLQAQFDAPHNCEQVPGENSSIKLAKKDAYLGFNQEYSFYSNQFIPLIKKANMLDRIQLQGKFDKHFSGGAILHLNVEQTISQEQMADLIRHTVEQGVVYFAVNYQLQQCGQGHMSVGRGNTCQICGGKIVANYMRVVGFLTATKNWAPERRADDAPQRAFYNLEGGL